MHHWRRWLALAGGVILLLGTIHLVFSYLFLDFLVDHLWFQSLGYEGYFWLRVLYRYAVFGAVTLLFFMVFFLNFWLASRFLPIEDQIQTGVHVSEKAAEAVEAKQQTKAEPLDTLKSMFALDDAPTCAGCGSIMVRNGSCYKCMNCGETSGCS